MAAHKFKFGDLQLTRLEGRTLFFLIGREMFRIDDISEKDICSWPSFRKKMRESLGIGCCRPPYVKRNRISKWWEREVAFAKAYQADSAHGKAAEPNDIEN